LGIRLPRLEKSLTHSFESGLIDLAIALYDVDLTSSAIGKSGNLPCALIPAHCSGATVEGFDKDDCLVGGHSEAIGKCLVVKCFAPFAQKWPTFVLSNSQLGRWHPASGVCLQRPLVQHSWVRPQCQLGLRLSGQQFAPEALQIKPAALNWQVQHIPCLLGIL
jgi:hypothetical protein